MPCPLPLPLPCRSPFSLVPALPPGSCLPPASWLLLVQKHEEEQRLVDLQRQLADAQLSMAQLEQQQETFQSVQQVGGGGNVALNECMQGSAVFAGIHSSPVCVCVLHSGGIAPSKCFSLTSSHIAPTPPPSPNTQHLPNTYPNTYTSPPPPAAAE